MRNMIIIIVLIVGIIGAAVVFSGGGDQAAGVPSNNFYGLEQSSVTVTEYGDFECPACSQFAPIVAQVKENFKDEIRFEFKHFPLVQIHPNSIAAHRSAEAAAKQGKFWEMHDMLYSRVADWRSSGNTGAHGVAASNNPASIFEGYAAELGLDMEIYKVDVKDASTISTINTDIAEGRDIGTQSTPTFYINGKLVEDLTAASTVEGFSALIQAELDATSAN